MVTDQAQGKFAQDLLHTLQTHQQLTPLQWSFMWFIMAVPLPFNWKLALYNNIYSHNSNGVEPIIFFYAIGIIILIFIVIIALFILPKIISFFYYKNQKYVLLSVKPPYNVTQSTFSTTQLFTVIHSVGRQMSWWDVFWKKKRLISCELVSTKDEGIRYVLRTPVENVDIIKKSIYAYLPGAIIKEVTDYLPATFSELRGKYTRVLELKLSTHFLLPIQSHTALSQHDPIAFITAHMTKLPEDDLIAMQVILTPVLKKIHKKEIKKINKLENLIYNGFDITPQLNKDTKGFFQPFFSVIYFIFYLTVFILLTPLSLLISIITRGEWPLLPIYIFFKPKLKQNAELSKEQTDLQQMVRTKASEELFEASVRFFLSDSDEYELYARVSGLISSLSVFQNQGYQSFDIKRRIPLLHKLSIMQKLSFLKYKYRLLSFGQIMVLSVSEISSLYHFPYTSTTKTENMAKVHSKELPTPLSLKKRRKLQVIFGNNTYGGTKTPISLTSEERETHMYIIGRTGSGKTTLMSTISRSDIENGEGLAFIDPHGDVSEDLLMCIPETRKNDLIYVNPIDLKFPIGINLLELTPGLEEDDAALEKEVVCEGVVSLFRKVFSKEENANAHRIEYILRNTIHTAFTVEGATIFTVYDLLTNPPFQKRITKSITDPYLQNFWKYEFGKAGDYQIVKMVGGVTAKVGRFLFSPTARRILEQKKSTINFDEIMNQGKILLCNFSQGNLGEDTARLLGTTILTKIQQAALRRAKLSKEKRKPFYLYIDEFQNFATNSFIKMLSEGRKYGLSVTIAEQSTSQQEDKNLVHNILANVTTVVCFRSANPIDEELMLTQFAPYVEKGDIGNLPRYKFYCKISALEPEESFSGETIFIPVEKDENKKRELIKASRDNYATVYQQPEKEKEKKPEQKKEQEIEKNKKQTKPDNKNKQSKQVKSEQKSTEKKKEEESLP